jgi:hypothetical protein
MRNIQNSSEPCGRIALLIAFAAAFFNPARAFGATIIGSAAG